MTTRRARGARTRVQDVALALLATSVDDAPIAQVACRLGISPHQVRAWAAAAWRREREARWAPLRRRC
jgi:hypothetical protein